MTRNPPAPARAGFALTEAVIALLLLAIALLGAGSALLGSLVGQQNALMQTRAADLAGDLAEALRATSSPVEAAAELLAWQTRALRQLPQARANLLAEDPPFPVQPQTVLPERFHVSLQWQYRGADQPAQLILPIGLTSTPPAL